jgi:hypothetical protein
MGNQKDFYNEINQERRCQVGLHNFPTYDSEGELLICKRCKYMQLPYEFNEPVRQKKEIEDTFQNLNIGTKGHETRDGTINFDKTW